MMYGDGMSRARPFVSRARARGTEMRRALAVTLAVTRALGASARARDALARTSVDADALALGRTEACRAQAWMLEDEWSSGADSAAACARVAGSSEARCAFAVASATCRLREAGARARTRMCGDARAGDCERCVLRALAREGGAASGGTGDEGEDEMGDDSSSLVTLDRSVEFAIYVDETRAVDRDCKHVVSAYRAELATRALESLSTRLAEAQRLANARAESLAESLRAVEETARRNARDARDAAEALADVRARQRAFADDFDAFAESVGAALSRVESMSAGALRAARFAAELARWCARTVAGALSALASAETLATRLLVLIVGVTRKKFRARAFTALFSSWLFTCIPWATPASRLRLGLLLAAVAPELARGARARLRAPPATDAHTSRAPPATRARSASRHRRENPVESIDPPRRASARVRASASARGARA